MSSAQPYIQACVDGVQMDARQPAISPLDRSFLYGDSLYEVWRTYDGVIFGWDEHWERLEQTAAGIGLELPWSQSDILASIRATADAWRSATGQDSDLYIRLQISRGAGPIGLDTALADKPTYILLVKALPDLTDAQLDAGMTGHLVQSIRRNPIESLSPALKTGNYLNNLLGLREARAAGAEEAIFLNLAGRLTEGSVRNLWLVFKNRIATPALSEGLLAGVTRRVILERIRETAGLPIVEEPLDPAALTEAIECFFTSSTQDIQPVRSIGAHRFALGPDTVSRQLKRAFRKLIRERSLENSKLKLF